jgi:hypothetical protein
MVKHMYPALNMVALATPLMLVLTHANAQQQSVKILTPTEDTCDAYTSAIDANEQQLLLGLGGWAIGYFSGVAQGAEIDFLRETSAPVLFKQLYSICLSTPDKPLSVAAEAMARELIATYQRR